jgi:nucleotide-binding universal stress UspA family protein
MYSDVIVPLDGSPFSEEALEPAAFLAAHGHAALLLVRVHELLATWDHRGPEWDEFVRSEEHAYLEDAASRRGRWFAGDLDCAVLDGPAAQAICERAKAARAAIIVMSTHGRTGLRRSWLGSVADGVMRHSSSPVLILRPSLDSHASSAGGSAAPFRNVIVTLDGSPFSEHVIPHALDVALASAADVLLLRVVEPLRAQSSSDASARPAASNHVLEQATTYVDGLAGRLRRDHPSIEIRGEVEVSSSPGESIFQRARHSEQPLVALTSHGRGLSRLFFGSVADSLLHDSAGAMLVVRADEARV